MSRPSQPLRVLLALGLVLAAAMLMLTLLSAADAALSVWERLRDLPPWLGWGVAASLALLGALAGWGVWRLLRPRAPRPARAEALDRDALERRIVRLDPASAPVHAARAELDELQRRRASGRVQVVLMGEISAGKSSVLRALVPEAEAAIDVVGGTTRAVARHLGTLPDGTRIEIADVPGLQEAGDEAHAALARAEAARAHALLFVVDADLTRSQAEELQRLAQFGRPLLLLLNKADRFDAAQRAALLARLRERAAAVGARVLAVQAGHLQQVMREWPDGRREPVERLAPADLGSLPSVLRDLARLGSEPLEPGREAALFAHVDAALAAAEQAERSARSEAAVRKYTRRAVVGALAAVAPGTDLVIQGALATALLRELCAIHDLGPRDADLDDFLARAGGLVRTTTAVTLAIAGNGLKAFPGLGTLGGGLVHAVAYGLIFDSLGRAAAQSLAATSALDREATLEAFRARLSAPAGERVRELVALALQSWQEREPDASRAAAAARQGAGTP